MVTVEWYLYQTTLQGFVDAMLHCGNALCIKNETIKLHNCAPIPSDTRSNVKVDVCVLLVVFLRGCQSIKKRPVFLPRTFVFIAASSAFITSEEAFNLAKVAILALSM